MSGQLNPVEVSQAKEVGYKTVVPEKRTRPRGESIANLGNWKWLLWSELSLMEWETEGRSWAIDTLQQQLKVKLYSVVVLVNFGCDSRKFTPAAATMCKQSGRPVKRLF